MMAMEERVSRLEGAYEQVDRRLGDLSASMERLEARLDAMDTRLDAMGARLDAKFNTLIGVMATMGIAVAGGIVLLALRIP